ncbi:MAG: hypothetical protein ABH871_05705 [Pseudomonadota bacterium]
MKKFFVVAGILAVAAFLIFTASKGFAWGVPSSVTEATKTVTEGPQQAAYDACNAWANQHKDNMSFNSSNIENEIHSREFSDTIYEKDYRKGGSDYDKKNQRLELRATYNQFAEVKIRCDKEKCNSIWCNKK